MLVEMHALHTLPGVIHALPFHLSDDVRRRPARCELVAHPTDGWAVATELAEGTAGSLLQCPLTLAATVCQQFGIAPGALALFTRYAYSSNCENVYAVRFGHGEQDLFNDIRFLAPRRNLLTREEIAGLLETLRHGRKPAPTWRALFVSAA